MSNRQFLISMLGAVLLLAGCSENKSTTSLQSGEPVALKAYTVALSSLGQGKIYTGTVEALETAEISTRLSGWIAAINVREGSRVRRGEVMATLQSQDIKARQSQAEAMVSEAEAHLSNVRLNHDRISRLFAGKAATQKEMDDISSALQQAEARHQAAVEQKKEADVHLAYTRLTAPFDGLVSAKMADRGDLTKPGQPLLVLENTSKMKVVVKVPESDIADLNSGTMVQVYSWAANDRTALSGKIEKISPAADPRSRQFDVTVVLTEQHPNLKSGMFARVSVGRQSVATLMIPDQAVFRRGQLQGVFTIDDQKIAHLRWIRTGKRLNDMVEVLSGLNAGDQIALAGQEKLLDGQIVEVVK